MSLPTPNLDDLRFQRDLVDEARRRIVQYCPEWTDYNLSDPGITLIELFAWMTELMVYRLNRVPDKNYVKFMELLGITLQPASSARTELTFRLSIPFPVREDEDTVAVVPAYSEVMNRPIEGEEEVIFSTDKPLIITAPRLSHLRRGVDFARNYLPRLAVQDCRVFRDQDPVQGDMFYLGFDESRSLSGYLLQLRVDCLPTQATGVRRDDPPLVWECSLGEGKWHELTPSGSQGEADTTGGLNNPTGQIVFYLPLSMRADEIDGVIAFWVRCRFEQRRLSQGIYSRSPRVVGVKAFALGATTQATHATLIQNEALGVTTGDAGQILQLSQAPLLDPSESEVLEIQERVEDDIYFMPWKRVQDFSRSTRYDRHYMLNTATGEIQLGPSIRQSDGQTQQYGRVPEANRLAHFVQYRAGGGLRGNLPPYRLNVLRSTIPYIDSVTNLRRADGGRDPETLDEAKIRVPQELRSQQRAVTASDYEDLALQATRSVARVHCMTPGAGAKSPMPGSVVLLVVPAAFDSLASGDLSGLYLSPALATIVERYLDRYRLLTTTLLVREPAYMGIQVQADVVADDMLAVEVVRTRVTRALRNFLSPLALEGSDVALNEIEEAWEGWPFGRSLYLSDIHSLIQKVSGVRHVQDVRLYQRQVIPAREVSPADQAETATPVYAPLGNVDRVLHLDADMLICSLAHQINVVEPGKARTATPNGSAPNRPTTQHTSLTDGFNRPLNYNR